ncbi:Ferric reduction oxidase 2 [Heracleum sosnowskyi]|uniref:Ferric reduction oxidase 2 n=1 Tax=Heracleum sosnowskyi TaxID=360622 RepID=A0AAD8HID1_9APIA|nr:Ferric reduction oxidase 2 [Heracleum sosnowskyi]
MIWIMMPTNVFLLHWLPRIQGTTFCTFFGDQGANILLYAVPVLLMAILSCLYLHLQKNYDNRIDGSSTSQSSALASWRRPSMVKGPLGIVSWFELSFSFLFLALIVWSSLAYVHGMFADVTSTAKQLRQSEWEVRLQRSALILGLLGNICLAFLFFPVTRASPLLRLVGLTSESSIKYHIWLGHAVMTFFTAHSVCCTLYWINTNQMSKALMWDRVGISNVAGEVSLFFGLAMWMTTFSCFRRKLFELFLYTHYLYVLFIVFFILHVGFSYSFITLPGFYLFLVDRYLRFIQSQQKVRLVSARILPCEAVELNFSKSPGLIYNPTSIVFVNIPSISKSQWHPFTITSNSKLDCETLSIVIKSEGSWSCRLYEKFTSISPIDYLSVSLEGPYGPAPRHYLRHDMLVMVCGGSGITPFISILRELFFISSTTNFKVPPVLLVTAFKKTVELSMLELILPESGSYGLSLMQLNIEVYITREKESTTDRKKFNHTVWLKPNASDRPVYAVLGSNNWIWLGAITLASFIIFMLLIALLTQYYVYPNKHNTDQIYSETSKCVLSLLLMCVSIAIAATVGLLWNKRQNGPDMKRVQHMETPMTSPEHESWHYDSNRELESFPLLSLLQATKVHYGIRPNFRRILLNCEGSSVGVMVSGPTRMSQTIAAICSSSLTKNLHFESMSFSW